jgi:putative FmdB family regulatory protein
MPIYEYICMDCNKKFDALRSMSDADAPILCTNCQSEKTSRTISVFAAHSEGRVVAGAGNACNTCSTNNCSSCGI